jgi:hypothetical protein
MRIQSDDDLIEAELADFPGLLAASHLARMVADVPWFMALGDDLDEREIILVEDYLSTLGFPDAQIAQVANWEEAEEAARSHDLNTAWWEAEEQLRAGLIAEACLHADEETVMVALAHVANAAGEIVQEAARQAAVRMGVHDEELIRAAAGAAAQVCNQAALVLAAEFEDEQDELLHPFAIKYRLFEAGRWPLGVIGATYYLF